MRTHWFEFSTIFFLMCSTMATDVKATSALSLKNLRCEYKVNPLGIDTLRPRLSWRILSSERGTVQTAYQLEVAESPDILTREKIGRAHV